MMVKQQSISAKAAEETFKSSKLVKWQVVFQYKSNTGLWMDHNQVSRPRKLTMAQVQAWADKQCELRNVGYPPHGPRFRYYLDVF